MSEEYKGLPQFISVDAEEWRQYGEMSRMFERMGEFIRGISIGGSSRDAEHAKAILKDIDSRGLR